MKEKILNYKRLIIVYILIFILLLIRWYSNYFDMFFAIGPFVFCIILFSSIIYILYLLVDSLDKFIKTKNMNYILAFVYLLFFSFFYIFFPFEEQQVKIKFKNNYNNYVELINNIKNDDKLDISNGEYLELDEKYKKLSITNNIKVNKINDEYTVCFWLYKGLMIGDGSSMLVYSSDGIKTIADDNYFYDIVYLKEIENNWYYIETKF